jgi:HD-GYP domain-containing protein (c-di-GMP phosphodiesterase class II)
VLSSQLAACDAPHGVDKPSSRRRPATGRAHRRPTASSLKQWALVAAATVLVAGCPVAVVWWLRASDAISSPVVCVVLGMALSLCASRFGCILWEKRLAPRNQDLLFSELMLWGFLHKRYTEHRLASARDMLGPMSEEGRDALGVAGARRRVRLLERLVAGIETRDPYLHGHSRRVARHSWMIASRMGLSREEVARIRTAAAIHDVGKVNTPKAILHKPGRLTDEEYAVIMRHPGDGGEMATVLDDSELTSMVRHHHERLDGSGYPDGLTAARIPLGAQIIAVADTFDAITSARSYRAAGSHKGAIDILTAEAGTTLDATAVRAFCSHYAGGRPFALSAFLSGLPERALSWLGGSIGSVASAAKMLTVAALVGGVAAGSSALAQPAAKHSATSSTPVSAAALVRPVDSPPAGALSPSTATATNVQKAAHRRAAAARALAHSRSPATASPVGAAATQASQASVAGSAGQAGVRAVAGAGVARGGTEATHGKGGTPHGGSEVVHAKGVEAHGKSEAPHGKSEAPHGKSEAPHGKSEAPHGKSQEAHGNAEAPHGKSEEAHGNAEAPHGNSGEAPAKSEAPHGNSEEAPGKSGESTRGGKGEAAPGKSEETHGHS